MRFRAGGAGEIESGGQMQQATGKMTIPEILATGKPGCILVNMGGDADYLVVFDGATAAHPDTEITQSQAALAADVDGLKEAGVYLVDWYLDDAPTPTTSKRACRCRSLLHGHEHGCDYAK
jgi:hypothetical protein